VSCERARYDTGSAVAESMQQGRGVEEATELNNFQHFVVSLVAGCIYKKPINYMKLVFRINDIYF
jgi:hypothetical protein